MKPKRDVAILLSLLLSTSGPALVCARAVPRAAQQPSAGAATSGFVLTDGTPVKLKLLRALSSTREKTGDAVEFEVIEEVKVGEVTVIQRGAKAKGVVIEARPAGRMGRTGKLSVKIETVQLLNQGQAALRAVRASPNGSRAKDVALNTTVAGLLFFPVAPLFLLQKGENINVPQGTLVTAFINGDHALDRAKFVERASEEKPKPN
jgi:hypothetical protein